MEYKYHGIVEKTLLSVDDSLWSTSPLVSKALLECPRACNMAKKAVFKFNIDHNLTEEISSEMALIIQTKCIRNGIGTGGRDAGEIEKIEDIYFLIFQTIQYICMNLKKNVGKTLLSPVSSFSEMYFDEESEEEFLAGLNSQTVDIFDVIDKKIDVELAKKRLKMKLQEQGWPKFIPTKRPASRGRPTSGELSLKEGEKKDLKET